VQRCKILRRGEEEKRRRGERRKETGGGPAAGVGRSLPSMAASTGAGATPPHRRNGDHPNRDPSGPHPLQVEEELHARWTAGLRPAVAPILREFDRGSGVGLDA
ncbi:MAG: hypothetical protein ACO3UM_10290, partial [Planctomycetota bacterium]